MSENQTKFWKKKMKVCVGMGGWPAFCRLCAYACHSPKFFKINAKRSSSSIFCLSLRINPSLPLPPPLPLPLSLPPATTVAADSLLFHRSANNNKDNNKNNNAEPAAASFASTLCLSINILQNNRAEISWAKQIIGEVTD